MIQTFNDWITREPSQNFTSSTALSLMECPGLSYFEKHFHCISLASKSVLSPGLSRQTEWWGKLQTCLSNR